ncbi:hypothetical protein HYN56_15310 [Flavobacterium crocinum]|uniref:Adhesin n=1 Tax=Flavobacterium crocinum TaxID=2183896 RepID=A0A2S1YNA7_9FLAO|nr:hypothetical protein [Flavobacterium crocinum]AWK05531.1 hypothetical protein HYN56_15310 [Flavobacterium crocinum]
MKTHVMLTLFLWFTATVTYSQVGMTTNNPNKDAVLDLNNSDGTNTKGLLLPKVALTATNSPAPLSTHIKGMKVYNTTKTTITGSSTNQVIPGIYYNDGSQWILENPENTFWSTTGNSGTVAGTNKIGSLNWSYPLITRTNNVEATRIFNNYLIGTSYPLTGGSATAMAVKNGTAGAIQLIDGTQGTGKILTSNSNGLATWQDKPSAEVLYPNFVPAGGGVALNTVPGGNGYVYTGCSLTLPPGKWLCKLNLIMKKTDGTYSAADSCGSIVSYFSESSTSSTSTTNTSQILKMRNMFPPNSLYGMIEGHIILENTTASDKTYYYWAWYGTNSRVNMTINFPAAGPENKLIVERIY